ncbi:ATP-dependent nuclease [Stenotrophomonas bentonitica]|uniref:ATP-dependent nuclease n=1 Tax=Stenotrophomonas bentonitica TaxID=1450134 RepID=UPI003BA8A9C2
MHITRVRIKNFRSIADLDLPLSRSTVLIGPNNAGKTAILEALRISLTRRWGQRGTGFNEYDIRLDSDGADPKLSQPIEIEVELTEQALEEWGEDIHNELSDIINTDPETGCGTIIMRTTCAWDAVQESYVPEWKFLNSSRNPFRGAGARSINMTRFFEYIPVFYLDALRDAKDEFSAKSQFWGRILRAVNIPSALAKRAESIFDILNKRFLAADPRVERVSENLQGINGIATEDDPGDVAIRVVPFKTWDLISRSQVILKNTAHHPWLPLNQHGRGVQSLSVIFVFHAFVQELLRDLFRDGSEAFLALEEPETHLHPQATRTLWRHVSALPGQKVVTTHSPYFVQHVPFRDLRLIKGGTSGTSAAHLPETFEAEITNVPPLAAFVATRDHLSFDASRSKLIVRGKLEDGDYRKLLPLFAGHVDQAKINQALADLKSRSALYVPDEVLLALDEFARRIRGEIFFAKRWLLVEGQSDYLLCHAIGDAAGYSLDAHGVSVIDCKNNGNPTHFAVIARALGIPWLAVFDNDGAGKDYVASLQKAGFSTDELKTRCALHVYGDVETQLFKQGGEALMREVGTALGVRGAATCPETELLANIKAKKKVESAVQISSRLAENPALLPVMPQAFTDAIRKMRGLN